MAENRPLANRHMRCKAPMETASLLHAQIVQVGNQLLHFGLAGSRLFGEGLKGTEKPGSRRDLGFRRLSDVRRKEHPALIR